MTSLKYDVALSFAGEDRRCAEMLAEELKKRGIKVFYDRYEKATIWGKDLYSHLSYVYQKQAQFCVIFLSESYASKLWTNLERRSAQARALEENKEYILPIRLDSSEIPGFLPTTAYLNWADESVNTIAEAIAIKLDPGYESIAEARGTPKRNIDPEKFSLNSLSPIYFESFDFDELSSVWAPFQDDIWTSTIVKGTYRLKNTSDPKAVKYIYIGFSYDNGKERETSQAAAAVEVKSLSTEGNTSGGGLIYRFDKQSKRYYVFLIFSDGRFSFYRKDSSGYSILHSGRSKMVQTDQFNKLGIVSDEDVFYLYVNDVFVWAVRDAELEKGIPGIVAMGTGEYLFDNFSVYEVGG